MRYEQGPPCPDDIQCKAMLLDGFIFSGVGRSPDNSEVWPWYVEIPERDNDHLRDSEHTVYESGKFNRSASFKTPELALQALMEFRNVKS